MTEDVPYEIRLGQGSSSDLTALGQYVHALVLDFLHQLVDPESDFHLFSVLHDVLVIGAVLDVPD